VTPVTGLTIIAVDWSGARRPKGIWCAVVREGELIESRAMSSREEAVELVAAQTAPVVAGFDFSFSVPEWFAMQHRCATIDDVWNLAARDGDIWLRATPPFWRTRCIVAP